MVHCQQNNLRPRLDISRFWSFCQAFTKTILIRIVWRCYNVNPAETVSAVQLGAGKSLTYSTTVDPGKQSALKTKVTREADAWEERLTEIFLKGVFTRAFLCSSHGKGDQIRGRKINKNVSLLPCKHHVSVVKVMVENAVRDKVMAEEIDNFFFLLSSSR